MKLALIVAGLPATAGVVYAALHILLTAKRRKQSRSSLCLVPALP